MSKDSRPSYRMYPETKERLEIALDKYVRENGATSFVEFMDIISKQVDKLI